MSDAKEDKTYKDEMDVDKQVELQEMHSNKGDVTSVTPTTMMHAPFYYGAANVEHAKTIESSEGFCGGQNTTAALVNQQEIGPELMEKPTDLPIGHKCFYMCDSNGMNADKHVRDEMDVDKQDKLQELHSNEGDVTSVTPTTMMHAPFYYGAANVEHAKTIESSEGFCGGQNTRAALVNQQEIGPELMEKPTDLPIGRKFFYMCDSDGMDADKHVRDEMDVDKQDKLQELHSNEGDVTSVTPTTMVHAPFYYGAANVEHAKTIESSEGFCGGQNTTAALVNQQGIGPELMEKPTDLPIDPEFLYMCDSSTNESEEDKLSYEMAIYLAACHSGLAERSESVLKNASSKIGQVQAQDLETKDKEGSLAFMVDSSDNSAVLSSYFQSYTTTQIGIAFMTPKEDKDETASVELLPPFIARDTLEWGHLTVQVPPTPNLGCEHLGKEGGDGNISTESSGCMVAAILNEDKTPKLEVPDVPHPFKSVGSEDSICLPIEDTLQPETTQANITLDVEMEIGAVINAMPMDEGELNVVEMKKI